MDKTSDLLRQLGTFESCEARALTDAEHVAEEVPQWAEVALEIERDDRTLVHYLRRADGELICEVLHEVLHPTHGKSILQSLWSDLDEVMDELMNGSKKDLQVRGTARGLALAIARMQTPYKPDVDAVRREAVQRWESRQ